MRSRGRPTMKDVAALADVSFKTVSRVVNDEPGVSDALIERVTSAIASLGYRPDHGARTLRSSGTKLATIGVVHADITNPFFAAMHASFEQVASEHGCLLLSGSAGEDPSRQEDLIRSFTERRVDGLVVVPAGDATAPPGEALTTEIRRGTAIVFIDREPPIAGDLVMSDHRGGAELATRHLLARGHRSIAFIGSREHVHSVIERRIGFEGAMLSAGVEPTDVITGNTTPAEAEASVHRIFERPDRTPTAIFAAQNGATLGAVRALHQRGLQHEVALVGFDHIDAVDIVEPAITTVPQDATEVGRVAGELLFGRLLGERSEPTRRIVPVRLIARGSGEIPAPQT